MNPRYARLSNASDLGVRKHRPDYGLLIIACVLLGVGLIVMYSISPALAAQGGGVGDNYFVGRQFVAIILGLVAFATAAKVPLTTWQKWQKPLIGIALLLSLATYLMGGMGNRWIQLGTFSFQPVELVKFVSVIAGSAFLANLNSSGKNITFASFKPLLLMIATFSLIIVVLQRDLGSAFVLLAMAGMIAFIFGLPMKRLLIFAGVIMAIVILGISSTSYRRDRLLTFMQPEHDCVDSGYHACQALIAVGSGGLFGLGLGRSVQAYGYLPEAANDSIFAIYAEKFGFVGAVVLIALLGSLLLRILGVMQRAPNQASQLVCAGVFGWLAVQALVNIGAMTGLLPLKGITLPLISYGGTSLIFAMAALGLVFQVSGYTLMRSSRVALDNERGSNEGAYNRGRDSRPRYTITRRSY